MQTTESRRAPMRTRTRGRWRRVLLALAGLAFLGLMVAVVLDYRSFDRTSGGYEPPYSDWSGTPIDWNAAEQTSSGYRQRGIVVNSHLDCTTGMITFEVLGIGIDYRTVSDRAIAVHRPREACREAGFAPAFSD